MDRTRVAPRSTPSEPPVLPDAVCPQGVITADTPEPGSEEPAAPGTSALDALVPPASVGPVGGEGGGR